jgi:hypothetical protein
MNYANYFSDQLLENIKTARRHVDEQYRALVVGYSTYPFANARARICHTRIFKALKNRISMHR